ncbi:MAG: alpha/beta hydrolase-fold protein [Ignavibacteriales bacterium]|nr:alpha/beta hydrolase-fold protein [Ignavibacteriales bacterium]
MNVSSFDKTVLILVGVLASLFLHAGCDKLLSPIDATIQDRPLRVYLPPGYGTSTKSYPVVYLFDGDQWAINTLLNDRMLRGTLQEMIVVQVYSTDQRTSEFVPYDDAYITEHFGRYVPNAKAFANYIVGTVIPTIDGKYRTIKDRSGRAAMGFSFGGLFVTWLAFNYDTTFSMAGALSPSYWVANNKIFDDIAAMPRKEVKLWFDIGTREWDYYIPLLDVLAGKGLVYGKDFLYYEVKDGSHMMLDWVERIEYPLIMFKPPASDSIVSMRTDLEVIRSVTMSGVYFLRLNPVITLKSGIVHSAATFASYQLLNPGDGVVNRDGSFEFRSTRDLIVKIRYHNVSDSVVVGYQTVQQMK